VLPVDRQYPPAVSVVEKLNAIDPAHERLGIVRIVPRFIRAPDMRNLAELFDAARDGRPCIESKSPVDIEDALGMYRGNIFQNAPTWPFAERRDQAGTWGVETEYENVFLCGSSALRGGAVSGIPGHNAAMKVLQELKANR